MKPSEILREAVKLDWTQGALARDREGYSVMEDDSNAVCFCSLGRIGKLSMPLSPFRTAAAVFLRRAVGRQIVEWNDAPGRTREEVDAAFLKAAELAEKEGL